MLLFNPLKESREDVLIFLKIDSNVFISTRMTILSYSAKSYYFDLQTEPRCVLIEPFIALQNLQENLTTDPTHKHVSTTGIRPFIQKIFALLMLFINVRLLTKPKCNRFLCMSF